VRTVAVRTSYCRGQQRGVEATTNHPPGRRSLPQCGNERWPRWTIQRADNYMALVSGQYEPITDAVSLSAAAHRRQRGGGGASCCRRWRNHADGYIPVPSRAVFFFNASQLSPCTVVPVPYGMYGTGTIVHAGFVPYVHTYVLRTTYGSGTIVHVIGLEGK
jgi:hypothetical protein